MMKTKRIKLIILSVLSISCTFPKEKQLLDNVSQFTITPCKHECHKDSIGTLENNVKTNTLTTRLGYVVNCSWQKGVLKDIIFSNDTLYLELDRPSIKTDKFSNNKEYPITNCDCFLVFKLKLNGMEEAPNIIRLSPAFNNTAFFDQLPFKEIIEANEIVLDSI